MNILLVDDNRDCRQTMVDILSLMGHQVVGKADAASALEVIAEGDFDLVFSDLRMPNMSGIELCREIRRLPNKKNCVSIVIISGWGGPDIPRAYEAGANLFINKPVTVHQLKDILQRFVEAPLYHGLQGT